MRDCVSSSSSSWSPSPLLGGGHEPMTWSLSSCIMYSCFNGWVSNVVVGYQNFPPRADLSLCQGSVMHASIAR